VANTDSARVWAPFVAFGMAAALAAVLAFVARTINRPPVIVTWDAQPAHVARDAASVLRVGATDPDGDALRYEYQAERGVVVADAARPDVARYTPRGEGAGPDRVTVRVTDTRGQSATATTAITIEVAVPPAASIETPIEAPPVEAPPPPVVVATATSSPSPVPEPPVAAPSRPPSRPVRAAPPVEARAPNHAPVLEGGSTIKGLGTKSVLLVATGYDPDGDAIEYEWDTKGCFDIISQSQTMAEVKLGYCGDGIVRLTWKDPHGLLASTEWTIWK
jgi:hypothetical protein